MKMMSAIATAVLAISTFSTAAHAVTELACSYEYKNVGQYLKIDHRVGRDGKLYPFMRHKEDKSGDSKLKFGTDEIQFSVSGNDKRMQNWIFVEAYSDIAERTFQLDLKNETITIIKGGRVILNKSPLSCTLTMGGE
ncbi:hypothetical protein AB1A81_12400 [Bdellovibrio bacteriovorus]|uniref:Adhesin n=1 Tax=Bdellovibrio bacteriovorus (strain ATCC 15356 / DSM 50701 / NCIMB 9529 / HD100) TaxID=264462 RepID=Q6MJR7_BDEBA|nr:hypothetical protein [Bdellovibrio bacteriovorus]CAE80493.1 hypothetical protein predicted by Glimmer/Critica [Bdellovibrio bacteriovorus HD100]